MVQSVAFSEIFLSQRKQTKEYGLKGFLFFFRVYDIHSNIALKFLNLFGSSFGHVNILTRLT